MDVVTLKVILTVLLMIATVGFSAWLPFMRTIVTRQVESGLMDADHARATLTRLCNGPVVLALGVTYALVFHSVALPQYARWIGFAIAIGAVTNSFIERKKAKHIAPL
jgi:hypothetical protein